MDHSDPFSPSEFDPWAETYDRDVASQSVFPFEGYEKVLSLVVQTADATRGMSVLDIGTGTGNLAMRLAERGCDLWCTDFSEAMLGKAREKLPHAHFILHDLRAAWPKTLDRRFDRIVSAYVFHHFELEKKVELCVELVSKRLTVGGLLLIADLSFRDAAQKRAFAKSVGRLWEEEPYWLEDEAMAALAGRGLNVAYTQVSACAGVYTLRAGTRVKSN